MPGGVRVEATAVGEYVAAAAQALSTDGGDAALESLGYWDLLAHLDDLDCRTAVFALFRAQGRTLAASGALGGLLAQPYLRHCELPRESVVASIGRQSTRRGLVQMVVGDVGHRHLIVDRPGLGASIVPPEAVIPGNPVAVPGRLGMHEVAVDWEQARTFLAEDEAVEARHRNMFVGRLALASEILGAAETAVALAVEHASHREQFGQPIGASRPSATCWHGRAPTASPSKRPSTRASCSTSRRRRGTARS